MAGETIDSGLLALPVSPVNDRDVDNDTYMDEESARASALFDGASSTASNAADIANSNSAAAVFSAADRQGTFEFDERPLTPPTKKQRGQDELACSSAPAPAGAPQALHPSTSLCDQMELELKDLISSSGTVPIQSAGDELAPCKEESAHQARVEHIQSSIDAGIKARFVPHEILVA